MLPQLTASLPRTALRFGILVLTLAIWIQPENARGQGAPPSRDAVPTIYKPVASDFRPEYLNDATNSRAQTWVQYWGWVSSYYQGNILSNGWIKETEISLTRVTDPARRAELLKEMNEAGRLVSREWAKDSGVRKITTNDLISWGNRLNTARREEKGNGVELLAINRLIHDEARRKISGKPAARPMPPQESLPPRAPQGG